MLIQDQTKTLSTKNDYYKSTDIPQIQINFTNNYIDEIKNRTNNKQILEKHDQMKNLRV